MKRRTLFVITVFCAIAVWAESGGDKQVSDWHAPAQSAGKENPLRSKLELAAGGRKLFLRNCDSCHGDSRTKAPDLASAEVQRQTDGELFWKLTNGNARAGMPSWSSIPEAQRWQIILYLRQAAKPGTSVDRQ